MTFSTTITTGGKLYSNECGTLLPLSGRLPQPHANFGLILGGSREDAAGAGRHELPVPGAMKLPVPGAMKPAFQHAGAT
jgi:hypothetical protein